MFSKFFSFTGSAFAFVGVFAVVMSADMQMMSSFENVWRTAFAFMIFAGAIHMLFVAMRQNNPMIGILAVCETAIAFTLVANHATFAESSPDGNPTLGLIAIAIILIANGITMVRVDGKQPSTELALASN